MSGPSREAPPRLWRRLLAALLPDPEAEFLLGDLEEDWRRIRSREGPAAADRWYRRQALHSAGAWLAGAWGGRRGRRRRALAGRGGTTAGGTMTGRSTTGGMMTGWPREIRHALRGLLRSPGFALATVLTLGLGLGGVAAVLALAESVLRPLPLPEPDRLVSVRETRRGEPRAVAPANYLDWRRMASSFEGLAAERDLAVSLTVDGAASRATVAEVSGNVFAVLGVAPALGPGFDPALDVAFPGRAAVLSHGLWQRAFGADPGAIGRTFQVDDLTYEVVGVMPPGFAFPDPEVEAWLRSPREAPDIRGFTGDLTSMRDAWYFEVVGRLADGVELPAARREMAALAGRLAELHPETNAESGVLVRPLLEEAVGDFPTVLAVLGAAVLLLLAAAATNAAHLVLARAAARRPAMAVRAALGAGRAAILRPLLAEGWALGLAGAAAGWGLATVAVRVVVAAFGADLPRSGEVAVRGATLLGVAGVGLAVGTVLGLLAFRGADPGRAGAAGALRAQRSGSTRARDGLVAAQVAAAVALAVGAALLGRSLVRLADVDPGFVARDLVTLRVALPEARLLPYQERVAAVRALGERLAAVPGVAAVGAGATSPLAMGPRASLFLAGQRDEENPPDAGWQPIEPGWLEALEIPLLRGRRFGPADEGGPDVGIVNATLARDRFGDEDPLGRQVTIGLDGHDRPITIVGVVADTRTQGPALPAGPVLYRPLSQTTRFSADAVLFAVRAPGAPADLPATLAETLRRAAPGFPVYGVARGEALTAPFLRGSRAILLVLGVFAATALALGAVGVYGVAAFAVRRRRREIGVRMALGADGGRVTREVAGRGLLRAAAGIPVGLALAFLLGRGLQSRLFGVGAADPATWAGVSALVLAVTALALWIPARRAAATDAAEVLRSE